MKYLKYFKTNEEWSKNQPIPELNDKEKLGIVLLGTPGSGKSTFIRNVIKPLNRNIKSFSTDDVSLRFTKDPKKYHMGSAELNLNYIANYIKTGQNFIYDTTGANIGGVFDVCKAAKKEGYKIIFILLLIDLESAKRFNRKRGEMGGHVADEEYIEFVYNSQRETVKSYMRLIKPENFYLVLNRGDGVNYRYYKHTGSEILKRKVDKYIPIK